MTNFSKYSQARKLRTKPVSVKSMRDPRNKLGNKIEEQEKGDDEPTTTSSESEAVPKGKLRTNRMLMRKTDKGKIVFGPTFKKCQTVEEVEKKLAATHAKFAVKAERGIRKRKVSDNSRAMVDGLLRKPEATSVCTMTSPRLVNGAFEHLHKALMNLTQEDPANEFAFATLIGGDGAISTDRPVIDLFESQRRAKTTFRAMAKNFIAVTEVSLFNNVAHPDGGQLMQVHEHAILWGRSLHGVSRAAWKHRGKFPANATEAEPIDVKPINDISDVNLARMAAYILKAPDKAINYCPPRDGKKAFLNKSEKGDRYIRYLRLAQLRSSLTFEDCFFAGGDGLAVRKGLVDILRSLTSSDAPANQRLLHPDAIAAFWVDLTRELRRDQWALPIFKRRK